MTLRKDTGPPIWAGGREKKMHQKVRVFYRPPSPKKSTYFAAADPSDPAVGEALPVARTTSAH
jgi:hypothetical protein